MNTIVRAEELAGAAFVGDLKIDYFHGDLAPLLKAMTGLIPSINIVFFAAVPRVDNGVGILGLSLAQALVVEALLRAQPADYFAEYGEHRFFRLEASLATWHTLTGERDAPFSWDVTLLQSIALSPE